MAVNEKAMITGHHQAGPDLFILEFKLPALAEACEPGQFMQVLVTDQVDPLLRRPISLFDADREKGLVRLLYKVVGRGTAILARKKVNDTIDIIGPLGKGFSLRKNENVVLVGGGVGIAPLVYLARVLNSRGCRVTVLHGVASRDQLAAGQYLAYPGIKFLPATMDGSEGYRGMVTDLLTERINQEPCDFIYTCGPEPMMAMVTQLARRHNIPGQVSLEEHMACGVGACLGCARRLKSTDEFLVKVCKDGPVFDMDAVDF